MRGNEMMKEKQTSGMEWMYSILNGASIAMLVAVLAAIGIMTCMAFASHADAKAKSSTNNSIGEVSFRAGEDVYKRQVCGKQFNRCKAF